MKSYVFMLAVLAVVAAILLIATFTKFKLNNEQYDRLKWIVVRWGYLVIFVGLIVKLFDVPYGVETVTIVGGIGALLGGLLGISSKQFKGAGLEQMFNEDLLKEIVGYKELEEEENEEEEGE